MDLRRGTVVVQWPEKKAEAVVVWEIRVDQTRRMVVAL